MTMISANLWHIQSTYWAHFRKFHIRMHLLKKQANLCEISIASLLLTPELSSVKLFYDFWFHKTSFIRENFGKAGTAQREGLGGGGGGWPPPPPPPHSKTCCAVPVKWILLINSRFRFTFRSLVHQIRININGWLAIDSHIKLPYNLTKKTLI